MKNANTLDPEILVHLESLKEKNKAEYEEYIKSHPELR
jgi:hypothetical protein